MKIVGGVVARGSDYVELLVNIITCRREPCAFSVGLFRNVSEEHSPRHPALERQFDQKDQTR